MTEETRAHYDRLARSYDEDWAYTSAFVDWMTSQIVSRLAPQPGARVADIGCGTGLYAQGLAERAGSVVCVDPSAGMLDQLPKTAAFQPVQASAEDLTQGRAHLPYEEFDAILIKEAVHHIPPPERAATLAWLADRLTPGGRLLVVMLPTRIDYPLFRAAIELFERHQPDPRDIQAAMTTAGLNTELTYEEFALSFTKDRYLAMVKNRYMSLLAAFTDEELTRGITEIDHRYPETTLEFTDRMAFVLGTRTRGSRP